MKQWLYTSTFEQQITGNFTLPHKKKLLGCDYEERQSTNPWLNWSLKLPDSIASPVAVFLEKCHQSS
jgi:hypothetical protein